MKLVTSGLLFGILLTLAGCGPSGSDVVDDFMPRFERQGRAYFREYCSGQIRVWASMTGYVADKDAGEWGATWLADHALAGHDAPSLQEMPKRNKNWGGEWEPWQQEDLATYYVEIRERADKINSLSAKREEVATAMEPHADAYMAILDRLTREAASQAEIDEKLYGFVFEKIGGEPVWATISGS